MNILGINTFHADASAALVQNGQLIAAAEEERFTRKKHWAGFPKNAIRFCLKQGGIQAGDLDHVAVSFNPKANIGKKLLFTIKNRPALGTIRDRLKRLGKSTHIRDLISDACGEDSIAVRAQFHSVEHHLAHAACAFFLSEHQNAAIVTIDGMGDFCSTLFATGRKNQITPVDRVFYPDSIGYLYNAITIYLGFPNYGDEYKVMGLAPYGEPKYVDAFRRLIRLDGRRIVLNSDYFDHHKDGISMVWENGSPVVSPFHSSRMADLLGPQYSESAPMDNRRRDLAASLQAVTEKLVFGLLQNFHESHPRDCLCLAGGVAMNSVLVGKIPHQTPYKQVFVPPGAADNGTSFGAAFYVWNQTLGKPRSCSLRHAYWGPEYFNEECKEMLDAASQEVSAELLDDAALRATTVGALVDGKIVGWFQGRMEFGARALGNRSLLADPRRPDIREIMNTKIKRRESFRPFAPSIVDCQALDFFEDDVGSPFMERVLPIREEQRQRIPAVTHVDGSGRLQSVSRATNQKYYDLIEAFGKQTGIPILLNTSLNENEPIVCTPDDAIQCFLRTGMDAIVIGNWFVQRRNSDANEKGTP